MPCHRWISVAAVAALAAALTSGCAKEPEVGGAPAASGSAAPADSSARGPAPAYQVDSFGTAVFVLPAPSGSDARDIKGVAKKFSGELDIDPRDLTRSRGTVAVDLASLETHGFGAADLDRETTERVRGALELDGGAEELRFARFTLRSVDEASERDVTVPSDAGRTVTLKVTGDLAVHGVARETKAELVATFAYDAGAISRVTVKTAQPIRIGLTAHGIGQTAARPQKFPAKSSPPDGAPSGARVDVTIELVARARAAPQR